MIKKSTSRVGKSADVQASLDRTVHAVFAQGRFEGLFQSYLDHASGLGPLPDEEALQMMRKSLAAATLHLALLPPDQHCSWTFNIDDLGINIFVAGDNNDFQITGRIYQEDVKTEGVNRLFYESQRPKNKPARSVVDFEGLDIFQAVHHFYKRSLQMRAKLLEIGPDDILLVQGLPIVDEAWFQELGPDAARVMVDSGLEPIEQREYTFGCGCDIQQMTLALHEMFAERLDDLFEGEDTIEVQCPRCGRFWFVERASLSAGEA